MMGASRVVRCAVVGASGYTGLETARLLAAHEAAGEGGFRLEALAGGKTAGQAAETVAPHLADLRLPPLLTSDEARDGGFDAVFVCLPHGAAQHFIAELPASVRVIDLSADFRLKDQSVYERWYEPHHAPHLLADAVYALPELNRDALRASPRLLAVPGCYPTACTLPLIPLFERGAVGPALIADAKSGVSGAGRGAKEANLYCEIDGNGFAYSPGKHRHTPEMEQTLTLAAGAPVKVHFTPQVIPCSRGIMASLYADLTPGVTARDAHALIQERYREEPFVRVLPFGECPKLKQVVGTNHCVIGVSECSLPGKVLLLSVIDNLLKGASGQALQAANVAFGFEETRGLPMFARWP